MRGEPARPSQLPCVAGVKREVTSKRERAGGRESTNVCESERENEFVESERENEFVCVRERWGERERGGQGEGEREREVERERERRWWGP